MLQSIKNIWDNIVIINNLGVSVFNMPLDYYIQTLDNLPFNKQPVDALKYLANAMNAYIYFNKNGELVIEKWLTLSSKAVTYSGVFPGMFKNLKSGTKKFFWDKLVDGVKITVKSYMASHDISGNVVSGEYLDGGGSWTRYSNIEPRNSLEKEVVIDSQNLSDYYTANPTANKLDSTQDDDYNYAVLNAFASRSEERRVGKECRSRWSPYH